MDAEQLQASPPSPPRPPSGVGLGRRLTIIFAVAALLATAAVALAGWAFDRQADARQRLVDRIDPAVLQAQLLLNAYVNEETGVRGFALTHQEEFLQPYDEGTADQVAANQRLTQLLGHEPNIAHLLGVANQRAQAWSSQWATPAIAAVRAGNSRAFASAGGLNQEKQLFDAVRVAFANLNQALDGARSASVTRLDHAATVFVSVLITGFVLLLVAGVVAWLAVRAWVTRPLGALSRDVRQVAAGNLDYRITPRGPPELASLGADAEAMRIRILDELEKVEQARVRLLESNTDLARSNVELEQFAYVASHDLQEPLRKVASFCQLLERRYEGQLDERAHEYIAFAVDGANRMQVLINDLLAFSRVGRTTERFVTVDLGAILRQVTRTLERAITEAEATVNSDPLPAVQGDATLLGALLQNLIANSVKFRGTEAPVVHIGCRAEDDHWLFDVSDNGIGIEPRFAERVFVIFQRLHAKDAYPGTGIGLALCKKIVEFHGGHIWIDPDHSPGTRIWWTLPMGGQVDRD